MKHMVIILTMILMLALALAMPPLAHAGTAGLGFQFTLSPSGALDHWWTWCLGANANFSFEYGTNGQQCAYVPGVITGIYGTSTVKVPNTEVLTYIFCGNHVVWQGEQYQGTVPIQISGLGDANLTGPCYVGIQVVTDTMHPGGYEIQAVIFYR